MDARPSSPAARANIANSGTGKDGEMMDAMSAPYEDKLRRTRAVIALALTVSRNPCVACSFGKGSEVVLHLVLQQKPNILVMFCNTGVEWPETYALRERLVKEWSLNYIETKPYKKTFWRCVDEYGVPHSKSASGDGFPKCCYYLKEKPAELKCKELGVDCLLLGMQAAESRNRRLIFIYNMFGRGSKYSQMARPAGFFYWRKSHRPQFRVNPIAFWTDDDVWHYIREHNLPYNRRYDMGSDRTGCAPCTAYKTWKRVLARANPKLLTLLLKKQGQSQLPIECNGGA